MLPLLLTDLNKVHCSVHHVSFRLPTSDEEFISGSLHDEVEKCQAHVLGNLDCKIEEVSSEKGTAKNSNKFVRE